MIHNLQSEHASEKDAEGWYIRQTENDTQERCLGHSHVWMHAHTKTTHLVHNQLDQLGIQSFESWVDVFVTLSNIPACVKKRILNRARLVPSDHPPLTSTIF